MDRPKTRGSSSEGYAEEERTPSSRNRRIPLTRRALDAFRDLTLDDEYGLPLGLGVGATIVWTVAHVWIFAT